MTDEQQIRALMKAGLDEQPCSARVSTVLGKARRQVGQRDTISFALIRIWAALARLVAPLFAAFDRRQAAAIHKHSARRNIPRREIAENNKGEIHD
jgi:hypothetical protein